MAQLNNTCSCTSHTIQGRAANVIFAKKAVKNHLGALDKELLDKEHYAGSEFSVADIYLFVMLGWPAHVGIDMSAYPNLGAYCGRIAQRPSVGAALKAEGLV